MDHLGNNIDNAEVGIASHHINTTGVDLVVHLPWGARPKKAGDLCFPIVHNLKYVHCEHPLKQTFIPGGTIKLPAMGKSDDEGSVRIVVRSVALMYVW